MKQVEEDNFQSSLVIIVLECTSKAAQYYYFEGTNFHQVWWRFPVWPACIPATKVSAHLLQQIAGRPINKLHIESTLPRFVIG